MDSYNTGNSLYVNLSNYIEVLIENYMAKEGKRPRELGELKQELNGLYTMSDVSISLNDKVTKAKLDNIFNLLKSSSIEEKDLGNLKNRFQREWNNFSSQKYGKIAEKSDPVLKLCEKACKKYPELGKDAFRLHKNNNSGRDKSRYQNSRFTVDDYYWMRRENLNRNTNVSFSAGLKEYVDSLKKKVNDSRLIDSGIDKANVSVDIERFNEQMKVITDYERFIKEGKISGVKTEPVTFFARIGFKPLKKSTNVKEIVERLKGIDYTLTLIELAIETIKTEKGELDFSATLASLNELKVKYDAARVKTQSDLDKSNYNEIKEVVEKQREIDYEKEQEKLKREKCRLLYIKFLDAKSRDEQRQLLEDIRLIDLSENIKNEEKMNVAYEMQQQKYAKAMEVKGHQESQQAIRNFEGHVMSLLRKRAIEELKMSGAFKESYVESNGDIRGGMSAGEEERVIQEKMQELASPEEVSTMEVALKDLQAIGFIDESVTLGGLNSFEYQALLAQMQKNSEVQGQGSSFKM